MAGSYDYSDRTASVVSIDDYRATEPSATEYIGGSGGGGGLDVDKETKRFVDKSMDVVRAENDKRFSEVANGLTLIGDRLDLQKELLIETKQSADEATRASKGVRWNIFITGLTVFGLMLAAWAIWAQGIEMVTAAFELVSGDGNDNP